MCRVNRLECTHIECTCVECTGVQYDVYTVQVDGEASVETVYNRLAPLINSLD